MQVHILARGIMTTLTDHMGRERNDELCKKGNFHIAETMKLSHKKSLGDWPNHMHGLYVYN